MAAQKKKHVSVTVVIPVIIFFVFAVCIYGYIHTHYSVDFLLNGFRNRTSTVLVATSTASESIPVLKQELLGKAEISYAGGTVARGKNIELGISRINGTVVAPGKEFSFTKTLGPVTEDTGYSEAKVFLNGEVTTGIGGGLCHVSTTLFRTILSAGLPVTERHNHTYTVSYYDVGLDATYSDPGPDLKFVNDTAYPVTIRGRTENQKAIFEIYGVSDGRIASTTEPNITNIVDFPATKYVATTTRSKDQPECINAPQIGYTAEVKYTILYATGLSKEQDFTSVYKPLQRVCYVEDSSTISINK
jgi:vancomycin resistance protein YoaR